MDSENEQCVFTDSWKNYSKFVLCKLATVKDDNALFLITELTLAVLATLNPELFSWYRTCSLSKAWRLCSETEI